MTSSIRPVNYASESQELINILQKNLPYVPHERFFEWLYLKNPQGHARTWVAIDSGSQRIIGVAAAFPRVIYCDGAEARGYVLGDFCIETSHRSLGLAVALQRACLDGLAAEGAAFAFDFPSLNMLAVYKRLRIEANGTLIRYAKPIRADRKIAQKVPVRALAHCLGAVANVGLRMRDTGLRQKGEWAIAAETGPWGEEFTQATREWGSNSAVTVARTARYLNWRYAEHPQQRYTLLTARLQGILQGYLIYHGNGEDCSIDDLLAANHGVRQALLAEMVKLARKSGVYTLSATWLRSHPGTEVLEKCGFHPREASPVVLLAFGQGMQRSIGPATSCWYLSLGDWES